MLGSAVVGGVLLGLIEGMGILLNRMMSEQFRPVDPRNAPQDPYQLGPTQGQTL
jgi:import inner membrane translocase subunit TIM17